METEESTILEIQKAAVDMRLNLLDMFAPGKVGHLGGSSSAMDIVATLYFKVMNYSKDNFRDENRDYFLMSKGHSVPAQYAALVRAGILPESEFSKMKTLGGMLQGHPDMGTPGMEAVTGSLGQGLSIGAGIAFAKKRLDGADNRVFVMCGDGEMAEGQIWEAAAFAANYRLSNLTMILDHNRLQASGTCEEVMCIPDLAGKWRSFGWEVVEIDGHDIRQILEALEPAATNDGIAKPKAVIAATVKGKGFAFAENVVGFHNGAMTAEQHESARIALLEEKKGLNNG